MYELPTTGLENVVNPRHFNTTITTGEMYNNVPNSVNPHPHLKQSISNFMLILYHNVLYSYFAGFATYNDIMAYIMVLFYV